jgi:dipeptidyl-peptidase III
MSSLTEMEAHFAILKCLLRDGNGFMTIDFEPSTHTLRVRLDRSRILSDGKPALGRMLLRLHMYRSTADVTACRPYYEDLSRVDGEHLEWRKAVVSHQQPKWVFVQANTWEEDGSVSLKEYPPTNIGVIKSWAERAV